MSLPPQPESLGRYRILAEIGRGAMGRVYRAHDPHTDRTVALKVLDPAGDRTSESAALAHARFLREARAAGRLSHPGIVAVYDADVDAATGSPYLVMELVAGRSLAELLGERGLLPWREAVSIAVAVADALDHAHERGVFHRDLKPANVLLAGDGAVKVSDFGVAMLLGDSSTLTGTLRGTPSYMAPEQIRGNAVDGRADLYSLGAVLYEMLTGEPPFQADTVVAIVHQAVHEEPRPPSFACPDLPLALEGIVLGALAKSPGERPASGRELAAELRAVVVAPEALPAVVAPEALPAGTEVATVVVARPPSPPSPPVLPPPAAPPRPGTRTRLGVGVLLAVLAATLATAVWLGRRTGAPADSAAKRAATEEAAPAMDLVTPPEDPPPAKPAGGPVPAAATPTAGDEAPAPGSSADSRPPAPDAAVTSLPANAAPAAAGAPAVPARASTRTPPEAPRDDAPSTQVPVADPSPPAAPTTATIELHFVHRIKSGSLEVWIDGARVWSTPLESPRNPLRRIGGEELIGSIEVPAGRREIEVRVANAAESIDTRDTVSADLAAGETHLLRVALPPLRSKLRLKWEP